MESLLEEWNQTENNLDEIRGQIFKRFIFACVILGFIAYVPSMTLAVSSKLWTIAVIDTAAYALILLFAFSSKFSISAKVITILILSLAIGIILLFEVGPFGAGYLWLFAVPLIAAVLLEFRFSIAALILNVVLLTVFGLLQYWGALNWNKLFSFPVEIWIVLSANFILLNIGTTLPLAVFIKRLEKSLLAEKEIADKLTKERIELIKAKSEAETADRLKSEFLAQMSHEVRSPINTILNFVSLIKDETQKPLNENVEYSFIAIENSSKRLIRTIDLILNMSQVQVGHLDCTYQDIDIEKDVLRNIIGEFAKAAGAKNLKLSFSNEAENPIIRADQYTVNQMFVNLIDNAVKYTYQGEINIRVYQDAIGKVSVNVCDTGIGMSEEYISRLFTPFSQEEQGYTRKYDGNGLGLALVKKYCELNNAQIDVVSKKGEGSIISVKFL